MSCRSCSAPLDVPDSVSNGSTEAVLCSKCGHRTSVAKVAQGYKAVFDVPSGELWFVSFGADDDRELTPTEIAKALAERRIGKTTLVWREGMAEWLPLAHVPELAELLKSEPPPPPRPKTQPPAKPEQSTADLTGGFLGTGLHLSAEDAEFRAVALSHRLADASATAPAPSSLDETPASSSGFLEADALEEAPLSAAPERSLPPPVPRRTTERPEAEARERALPAAKKAPLGFTGALPDDQPAETASDGDSLPPSSKGTPDLRSLAALAQSVAPPPEAPSKSEEPPELSALRLATVDAPGVELDSAPSSPKPVEISGAPPAPSKRRSKSRRSDSKDTLRPARARKDVRAVAPAPASKQKRPEPKPKSESKSKSSPLIWLLLGAAAIAALWLAVQSPKRMPEPVAAAPPPPAVTTEAPPEPAPAPASSADGDQASADPTAAAPAEHYELPPRSSESGDPSERAIGDAGLAQESSDAQAPETTFDRSAALAALAQTASEAAACRKPGDPDGNATVVITFAPSGRVTSAVVEGPPFAGTATGGCVAATMRKTMVPPFEGAYARVTRQIWVD